jgi:hypothetical protein
MRGRIPTVAITLELLFLNFIEIAPRLQTYLHGYEAT